jgi:putative transposase
LSIKRGSELLGYTEQSYHKAERHREKQADKKERLESLLKEHIDKIRQKMPRIGGAKLWFMIEEKLVSAGFSIGRDKFVQLYAALGYRVQKRKKRRRTTDSSGWMRNYEDLRKDLIPTRPEQLVVADITYIDTEGGDAYMHLITDAYSKMVMGYEVSHRMRAQDCLVALHMAIKNRQYKSTCIHHSDRGLQYISKEYTEVIKSNRFVTSTTQDGSPYENPVAERINRIIKEEFGFDGVSRKIKDATQANVLMKTAVAIYNKERPHMSNHMLTPFKMHQQDKIPIKKWGKKTVTNKNVDNI